MVRRRSVETATTLTAQEAYIAKLAGDGRTNPEIGAQLFLSAHDRMAHAQDLTKLGITSRRNRMGPGQVPASRRTACLRRDRPRPAQAPPGYRPRLLPPGSSPGIAGQGTDQCVSQARGAVPRRDR